MEETKYIKAPWKVLDQTYRDPSTDEYSSILRVNDRSGFHVCEIGFYDAEDLCSPEMSRATAHLISAAPELLCALKAFAALDDFSGWHPRYFDAIKKAQAAIAKAEPNPPT